MVEAYRRDAASKDQLVSELKATKKRLDAEAKELRQELIRLQGEKRSVEVEHARLQKDVTQARQQVADLEGHLQSVQRERDQMEMNLQVWGGGGLGSMKVGLDVLGPPYCGCDVSGPESGPDRVQGSRWARGCS